MKRSLKSLAFLMVVLFTVLISNTERYRTVGDYPRYSDCQGRTEASVGCALDFIVPYAVSYRAQFGDMTYARQTAPDYLQFKFLSVAEDQYCVRTFKDRRDESDRFLPAGSTLVGYYIYALKRIRI